MHPDSHRPGRNCPLPAHGNERKESKRSPSQIDSLSRAARVPDADYPESGNSVPWRGATEAKENIESRQGEDKSDKEFAVAGGSKRSTQGQERLQKQAQQSKAKQRLSHSAQNDTYP
jgi:hypothetical protein